VTVGAATAGSERQEERGRSNGKALNRMHRGMTGVNAQNKQNAA
jgi:hypothetical protein